MPEAKIRGTKKEYLNWHLICLVWIRPLVSCDEANPLKGQQARRPSWQKRWPLRFKNAMYGWKWRKVDVVEKATSMCVVNGSIEIGSVSVFILFDFDATPTLFHTTPHCTQIARISNIGLKYEDEVICEAAEKMMSHLIKHTQSFWGNNTNVPRVLSEKDLFDRFFSSCIMPSERGLISAKEIYDAFIKFVGLNCYTMAQFRTRAKMSERGYQMVRKQEKSATSNKKIDQRWYYAEFIETSKPFLYASLNGDPHDHEVYVALANKTTRQQWLPESDSDSDQPISPRPHAIEYNVLRGKNRGGL